MFSYQREYLMEESILQDLLVLEEHQDLQEHLVLEKYKEQDE